MDKMQIIAIQTRKVKGLSLSCQLPPKKPDRRVPREGQIYFIRLSVCFLLLHEKSRFERIRTAMDCRPGNGHIGSESAFDGEWWSLSMWDRFPGLLKFTHTHGGILLNLVSSSEIRTVCRFSRAIMLRLCPFYCFPFNPMVTRHSY